MFKLLLLDRDQLEKLVNLPLCFVLYEALLPLDLDEEVLVVLVLVEPLALDFCDGRRDGDVGFGRVGADFVGGVLEGRVARSVVLFVDCGVVVLLVGLFVLPHSDILKIQRGSPEQGVPTPIGIQHIFPQQLLSHLLHFQHQLILHTDNLIPFLLRLFHRILLLAFLKIQFLLNRRNFLIQLINFLFVLLFFVVGQFYLLAAFIKTAPETEVDAL